MPGGSEVVREGFPGRIGKHCRRVRVGNRSMDKGCMISLSGAFATWSIPRSSGIRTEVFGVAFGGAVVSSGFGCCAPHRLCRADCNSGSACRYHLHFRPNNGLGNRRTCRPGHGKEIGPYSCGSGTLVSLCLTAWCVVVYSLPPRAGIYRTREENYDA